MFAARYYTSRAFAARYFPKVGGSAPLVTRYVALTLRRRPSLTLAARPTYRLRARPTYRVEEE